MLLDEQYRTAFLLLVAEGGQTSGIDERGFLREVVTLMSH